MAEPRKVDQLAGKGSIADRLRRQRLAVESGDPDAARRIAGGNEEPEDAQYGAADVAEAEDLASDEKVAGSGKKLKLLKDLLIGRKK